MIRDHAALRIQAEACRRIWTNVLLQAARDLLTLKVRHSDAVSGVGVLEHAQAQSWIGSRDFREVCTLAGYDPTRIERAFRARLADKDASRRLFPHQGAAAHKAKLLEALA